MAVPKRGSKLYETWVSRVQNDSIEWKQELWVARADYRPLKAVFLSSEGGAALTLTDTRINAPVDSRRFQIPATQRTTKIEMGDNPLARQAPRSPQIRQSIPEIKREESLP